ncbi:MAG TPA: hypothetical protein VIH88_03770 [Candidatus Acidoferrales bacterium]
MKQQFMLERAEIRVDMKVTAMFVVRHDKLGVERAITENVSPCGVRDISTSEWMIDDTILVALPAAHFTAVARVAYCDDLGQGRFGTGLEFIGSSEPLEMNVLVTALESPHVWLRGLDHENSYPTSSSSI